jgi:8-oxo-dGTP diphosphatase
VKRFVYERSAGGVLLDGDRVLLILGTNLKGEPVWTFPKGLVEKGEKPEQTALREVREETGYEAEILAPLEPSVYWFYRDGQRVKKRVDWFLMRPLARRGGHDREVLETEWVPIPEAFKRLKYRADRMLLEEILERGYASPS